MHGRPPKVFGQQVTADHLDAKSDMSIGFNGERFAVVLYDRGTDALACYPVKNKSGQAAFDAMNDFEGNTRRIKYFYTDNAPELLAAGRRLGWVRGKSTQGLPQTNGLGESAVKRV